MKKIFLSCMLITATHFAFSQESNDAADNQVFTIVQEMPQFNGDMNKYFRDSIHYPKVEKEANIMGTVYINFIVEKDGSVSHAKVIKGVAGGPGLDAEALRVVSGMPKWTIGKQNGHPVRVSYNLPVKFMLK